MRQTVGSDTTNYLWDELSVYGDVVRETNGTGTELASYTLAETQLLAQTRSGVTSYYLSDGQGSTRALLNGTGDLTDTYEYTAFGEIYNQTASTLTNYRYTGQQFDSLTGLYSLRARYYDPGVGRFVSRDTYPINYRNPIELNRYGYVGNNPINGYDPSGFGLVAYGEINLKALGERVLVGAFSGLTTAAVGLLVTYLMAGSGACGEESKEWVNHLDPTTFKLGSLFTGFVLGGIFAIAPPIATIGVTSSALSISAGQSVPATGLKTEVDRLSSCFFSDTLKSITDQFVEPDREKRDITIAAASLSVPALGRGITTEVTSTTISIGLFSAALSGIAAGLIALVAAGAWAYDCDVDNDPSCGDWGWVRSLLRNRHILQPPGLTLDQSKIDKVRAYIRKFNKVDPPPNVTQTGHIAILQAKGEWFLGFSGTLGRSVANNVYADWNKSSPTRSAQLSVGQSPIVGLAEANSANGYPGYTASHAESNALLELWAYNRSTPDTGIMVVDAIPCGSDCYRPEDNKAGQIRAGAIANNLSSLRVSYPGGSITVP